MGGFFGSVLKCLGTNHMLVNDTYWDDEISGLDSLSLNARFLEFNDCALGIMDKLQRHIPKDVFRNVSVLCVDRDYIEVEGWSDEIFRIEMSVLERVMHGLFAYSMLVYHPCQKKPRTEKDILGLFFEFGYYPAIFLSRSENFCLYNMYSRVAILSSKLNRSVQISDLRNKRPFFWSQNDKDTFCFKIAPLESFKKCYAEGNPANKLGDAEKIMQVWKEKYGEICRDIENTSLEIESLIKDRANAYQQLRHGKKSEIPLERNQ